jgi:enamine deaminase RidA (YjgF/YER057c/UK114 family)
LWRRVCRDQLAKSRSGLHDHRELHGRDHCGRTDDIPDLLQIALASIRRTAGLTNSLLVFWRPQAVVLSTAFSARRRTPHATRQRPQKENAMSAEINIYNPEELGPPMGQYTHVTRVRANEFLFVAGMLSGDAAGNVIGEGEFDVQTAQVFRNIEAALKSAGASWANVVQFTTYLVHSQDIPKFMQFRLREFPKMFPDGKYPPNTLLIVDRLVREAFLVEVQTIAAV